MENILTNLKNTFANIDFSELIWNGILTLGEILLAWLILYLLKKVANRLIVRYFDQTQKIQKDAGRNETLKRLTLNVVQYIYYFALIYTILTILGFPIGTLLAGAGIAGIAIGFGAKDLVADVVNGFFILLENQFGVGDAVNLEGIEGVVIDMGLRTTVVRAWDGTINYIPNGDITLVTNFSQNEARSQFIFTIYPDTDVDLMSETLQKAYDDAAASDERLTRFQNVGLSRDAQGRLTYDIRVWSSYDDNMAVKTDLYPYFLDRLEEAGINLPVGEPLALRTLNDENEETGA